MARRALAILRARAYKWEWLIDENRRIISWMRRNKERNRAEIWYCVITINRYLCDTIRDFWNIDENCWVPLFCARTSKATGKKTFKIDWRTIKSCCLHGCLNGIPLRDEVKCALTSRSIVTMIAILLKKICVRCSKKCAFYDTMLSSNPMHDKYPMHVTI